MENWGWMKPDTTGGTVLYAGGTLPHGSRDRFVILGKDQALRRGHRWPRLSMLLFLTGVAKLYDSFLFLRYNAKPARPPARSNALDGSGTTLTAEIFVEK